MRIYPSMENLLAVSCNTGNKNSVTTRGGGGIFGYGRYDTFYPVVAQSLCHKSTDSFHEFFCVVRGWTTIATSTTCQKMFKSSGFIGK